MCTDCCSGDLCNTNCQNRGEYLKYIPSNIVLKFCSLGILNVSTVLRAILAVPYARGELFI